MRRQDGFTIPEVLAAAGLLVLLAGAGLAMIQAALQVERLHSDQAARTAALRRAARQVVLDLQFARRCRTVGSTELEWYVAEGATSPAGVYRLSGGELLRKAAAQEAAVAEGLQAVTFECPGPGQNLVRIELEGQPARPGAEPLRLATRVFLRSSP